VLLLLPLALLGLVVLLATALPAGTASPMIVLRIAVEVMLPGLLVLVLLLLKSAAWSGVEGTSWGRSAGWSTFTLCC
jgi:hypothetical protein